MPASATPLARPPRPVTIGASPSALSGALWRPWYSAAAVSEPESAYTHPATNPPNAVPSNVPSGAPPYPGCTACHTYDGSGGSALGAPDLTNIGTRHLGITFQVNHLKCPSCVNPGSPMPKFASLGDKRLKQLAIFLEASKGKTG